MQLTVKTREITVRPGRREVDEKYVRQLAESIRESGLLNPITVDCNYALIAGAHRLEAVKLLGWEGVSCNVVDLEGLQAELAEIDENLIRRNLNHIEEADQLLRRKEIYEELHPDTRAGIAQAAGMNKAIGNNVAATVATTSAKSFVADTSEKTGMAERTIRGKIQIAKSLTPEVKEAIRDADISERNAAKLARIKDKDEQKEAAEMLAAGKIRTVDEYHAQREEPESPVIPFPANPIKTFATFKESIADLKDPNKDCSATPEILLMEYDAFVSDFIRGIEWYEGERYYGLYQYLTADQKEHMEAANNAMRKAIGKITSLIERKRRHELQKDKDEVG